LRQYKKLIICLCIILMLLPSTVTAQVHVQPGDRLHHGIIPRGSAGFFIESAGDTYMITAAHIAAGWKSDIEPFGPWYVDGVAIGEFDRWLSWSGYNSKDVMAIRIYPGIEVSNKVDDIQPLGFVQQVQGMPVVQRGRDEPPQYGTAHRLPLAGINCNFNLPGVEPGHSGSAVLSVDPPGVLGIVRSAGGSLVFGVQARWAVEALGFEDYRLIGGLPENSITIGATVVQIDYIREHREEARRKINQALPDDIYIYLPCGFIWVKTTSDNL